jgi:ABC-type lipoprotein release transport system permease subunit
MTRSLKPKDTSLSIWMFAARALLVTPKRSVSLFLLILCSVFISAAILLLADALQHSADTLLRRTPDLTVAAQVGGRAAPTPRAWLREIEDRPGVKNPRMRTWGYVYNAFLRRNLVVFADPSERESGKVVEAASLALDTWDEAHSGQLAHEAVLGHALAKGFGVAPGDTLVVAASHQRKVRFHVLSVLPPEQNLHVGDVIFCSQAAAQHLLGYGKNDATDLAFDVTNASEVEVIRAELENKLPQARVTTRTSTGRALHYGINRRTGMVMLGLAPALLTLLLLMLDRIGGASAKETREIAVLKTLGWSTKEVVRWKLAEFCLIGVTAFYLGWCFAYLWVFGFGARGLLGFLMGPTTYDMALTLVPQVDVAQTVGIAVLGLGPYAALSVLAAIRSASQEPMRVLRNG